MNVARSQPSPYTLREKLLTYLHNTSLLNLQNAFENAQADPNMLLLADRDDLDRSGNAYTMLNWACYYRFEEAIAFLLLKGGDPFLRTQQICETEHHEISPSAIETVLHWYSKPAYSECVMPYCCRSNLIALQQWNDIAAIFARSNSSTKPE